MWSSAEAWTQGRPWARKQEASGFAAAAADVAVDPRGLGLVDCMRGSASPQTSSETARTWGRVCIEVERLVPLPSWPSQQPFSPLPTFLRLEQERGPERQRHAMGQRGSYQGAGASGLKGLVAVVVAAAVVARLSGPASSKDWRQWE